MGFEPMITTWQAVVLPLHQYCKGGARRNERHIRFSNIRFTVSNRSSLTGLLCAKQNHGLLRRLSLPERHAGFLNTLAHCSAQDNQSACNSASLLSSGDFSILKRCFLMNYKWQRQLGFYSSVPPQVMVRIVGLEPTRPNGHLLLRQGCLPIPPYPHIRLPRHDLNVQPYG